MAHCSTTSSFLFLGFLLIVSLEGLHAIDIFEPILIYDLLPLDAVNGDADEVAMRSGVIDGKEYFVLTFEYSDPTTPVNARGSSVEELIVVVFTLNELAAGNVRHFRIPDANDATIAFGNNEFAIAANTDDTTKPEVCFVQFVVEDTVNGGLMLGQKVEVFTSDGFYEFFPRIAYNPSNDRYLVLYSMFDGPSYSIINAAKEVSLPVNLPTRRIAPPYDVVFGGTECNCFVILFSGLLKNLFHFIVRQDDMPVGPDFVRIRSRFTIYDMRATYHPTTGSIGVIVDAEVFPRVPFLTGIFVLTVDDAFTVTAPVSSVITQRRRLDESGYTLDLAAVPDERGAFLGIAPRRRNSAQLLYLTSFIDADHTVKELNSPEIDPEYPAIAYGPISCVAAVAYHTDISPDNNDDKVWLVMLGPTSQLTLLPPKAGRCARRLR